MSLRQEGLRGGQERQHDEALMPVTMGAPYRVPHYAYPNWGLVYKDESLADRAYRAEWDAGNSDQLGLVSKAITEAGFGNFPELLRRQTGEIVASLLKDRSGTERLRIMDIGAGPGLSALAVYEALPEDVRGRVTMVLVEPSEGALEDAQELMRKKHIKFQTFKGADTDAFKALTPGSIDVLTGVASVHHHARIPFRVYSSFFLKRGGIAVFADWHQPIWEHPGSVYEFLKRFDWPKKEEGLRHWLEVYPEACNIPPLPDNPADRMAIEQITKLWLAYKKISDAANLGPNALWPLEGHRPVQRYAGDMQRAGFVLDTPDIKRALANSASVKNNPQQILPDSSLLQVTVGQAL